MSEMFRKGKSLILVICLQFGFAGMDVLALNDGIVAMYLLFIAFIVMAPFAIVLGRSATLRQGRYYDRSRMFQLVLLHGSTRNYAKAMSG
ncbi:hypothetical protein HanRHA438_Chr11g0525921 [Helianthus annuus]|nr:hypothetical protein HanRHA438_Chr11g0525921 [Helianthus annuus]